MPQLSVVGIAGPGDALASHRSTFATCDAVAERFPDLKLCLSTNGLALPEHVEDIRRRDISHITITINAIDPAVAERIYPWIAFEGGRRTGRDAAEILLERQWRGLEMAVEAGILVKVNSVMIPGVNDGHLAEVNAEVRARGAFLHNIMPLISDPQHGTHYGLSGQRGPSPMELKSLQDALPGQANLMKHCRQCRADAVGMLGEDQGQTLDLDPPPDPEETEERREAYRTFVASERAERRAASEQAEAAVGSLPAAASMLIAVCTKGGGRINQHFGHASEFQVYEADAAGVRLVGHRRAGRYCQGGFGEEEDLERVIEALEGISVVLCAKVGRCPQERLARAGIRVLDTHAFAYIEAAAAEVLRAEAASTGRELRTA
jgi:nitrogen fixation protein NifB